jgi:hypothetical protein
MENEKKALEKAKEKPKADNPAYDETVPPLPTA